MIYYTKGTPNYFHAQFKVKLNQSEFWLREFTLRVSPVIGTKFWNSLQANLPPQNVPWIFLGDLNEVTNQSENFGGRIFNPNQCIDFDKFIDEACMVDSWLHGNPYTWNNVKRFMSNQRAAWLSFGKPELVKHLPINSSTLSPLKLIQATSLSLLIFVMIIFMALFLFAVTKHGC